MGVEDGEGRRPPLLHHMAVRERDLAEQREYHEMEMEKGKRRLILTAGVRF